MICEIDHFRAALRMHQDNCIGMKIVCLAHMIRCDTVMNGTKPFPWQDLFVGKPLGIESEIAIWNKNYLVFL